jgi:acyl carrier protein
MTDKMIETEIKDVILKIFHEERQKTNAYFSESHFLDFLSFPPHQKNTLKNTFRGVRRYYRFMNKLELEFGICFSLSDVDKYYSIDSITKKVIERINKRRGNLMILKQRNEQKERYGFEIIMIILLFLIYFLLRLNLISIILTVFIGIAFYWILSNKIHNKRHNKKLTEKILGKTEGS